MHIYRTNQLKQYYRRLRWLLYRKPYACKTIYPARKVDPTARNSFFGYYDKSPLSPTEDFIVYHTADSDTRARPTPSAPVHVVARDRRSGEIIAKLESTAYNWQQGTRAQWLSEDRFIYNLYHPRDDSYIAQVYSVVDHRIVATFPNAIYDCFNNDFALTLNFKRLARVAPDYGYFCHASDANLAAMDADGVWRIDMQTGARRLVLRLAEIAELAPTPGMNGAQHSVNHIMIAPDGARFVVIHRWYEQGQRHDRLLVARTDGSDVRLLADNRMVSHCFWLSNSRLLSYLRHDGIDGYYSFDVSDPQFSRLANGIADGFGDGHPNMLGQRVIFDTYPDRARMQRLFLLDLQRQHLQPVGEFFEPIEFHGESRCDLHPRFDRLGARIFFDSTHDGSRQLYEMRLGEAQP